MRVSSSCLTFHKRPICPLAICWILDNPGPGRSVKRAGWVFLCTYLVRHVVAENSLSNKNTGLRCIVSISGLGTVNKEMHTVVDLLAFPLWYFWIWSTHQKPLC